MSTNSSIAWKSPEGFYEYRYHHFDGHIEGVGRTLIESFNDTKKVKELFDFKRNFSDINFSQDEYLKDANKKEWTEYHKSHAQISDRRVTYYTDDSVDKPEKNKKNFFKKNWQEYLYFFDSTKKKPTWVFATNCYLGGGLNWMPLKEALSLKLIIQEIDEIDGLLLDVENKYDINNAGSNTGKNTGGNTENNKAKDNKNKEANDSNIKSLVEKSIMIIEKTKPTQAWSDFVFSTIKESSGRFSIEQIKHIEEKLYNLVDRNTLVNIKKQKI